MIATFGNSRAVGSNRLGIPATTSPRRRALYLLFLLVAIIPRCSSTETNVTAAPHMDDTTEQVSMAPEQATMAPEQVTMAPEQVTTAPEQVTMAPEQVSMAPERSWRLIRRNEWKARAPIEMKTFEGPAPYVIVHHSYVPDVCLTEEACKAAMRGMQNYHMNHNDFPDIGYSFAVGGDGNVYEGVGYNVVGAHAPNYNSRSIGLLLIGNFMEKLPPDPMTAVAQDFLKYSVEQGHLQKDYILYGHRQVRSTQCPGDAFYPELTKWPHWAEADRLGSTNAL